MCVCCLCVCTCGVCVCVCVRVVCVIVTIMVQALQIGHCFKILAYFHDDYPDDVIPLLCKHFIGSYVLAVAMAAQGIIVDKVRSKKWSNVMLLQQLIQNLPPTKHERFDHMILFNNHS